MAIVESIAEQQLSDNLSKYEIWPGDTVKITNSRAKNTGESFEVKRMGKYKPWTDLICYGKNIHSAAKNCEIVELSNDHARVLKGQIIY